MRRYEVQEVTVRREVELEATCDGCGLAEGVTGTLVPVAIEVNLDEEYGRRDEYDYCDDCLVERAPLLAAAGSRSFLVTGNDEDDAPGVSE